MFEKVIYFIGRFLSNIFISISNVKDNITVNTNMVHNQIKSTTIKTKSILNVSISEESHINYFNKRIIGEFIRVIASLIEYKHDKENNNYTAYLVRKRSKIQVEYIKFTKESLESDKVKVVYTFINKLIDKTGVSVDIGDTKQDMLSVDINTIKCIIDSISGTKSPLYLLYNIDDNIEIGNDTFVYDCWILTSKIINRKTDEYIKNSLNDKGIEYLRQKVGLHVVMSYFKSLNNNFYKNIYRESSIKTIVDIVTQYNSLNTTKYNIIDFYYSKSSKDKFKYEINKERNYTVIGSYGLYLRLDGILENINIDKFDLIGNKLLDVLNYNNDINLRRNVVSYMFSIGSMSLEDISKIKSGLSSEPVTFDNKDMETLNSKVEEPLSDIMKKDSYTENESGEFESDLLYNKYNKYINDSMRDDSIKEIVIQEPIIKVKVNNTVINKDIEEEEVREYKQEVKQEISGNENVLDILKNEYKESIEKPKGNSLSKPIAFWTEEECLKVLSNDTNKKLSKEDKSCIMERLAYFLTKSGE